MSHAICNETFLTVEQFFTASRDRSGQPVRRIVHCVNPFPAQPGSEHHRAQTVTLASMTQARAVAQVLSPELEIAFAAVTVEAEVETPGIVFDSVSRLDRTVLDLGDFQVPRPLPLMSDILAAPALAADDVLVFTNIDIALVPGFYGFVADLFRRGADCAIVNRRTIANAYANEGDCALMAHEAGEEHPGFDCFAFRGALRDALLPYDGCVGIRGVMLPLVHQLLARAAWPVVLLDAHATYHIGDDRQWTSDAFADYTAHNRSEINRVFDALSRDDTLRERLVRRLQESPRPGVFPNALRANVGLPPVKPAAASPPGPGRRVLRRIKRRLVG